MGLMSTRACWVSYVYKYRTEYTEKGSKMYNTDENNKPVLHLKYNIPYTIYRIRSQKPEDA